MVLCIAILSGLESQKMQEKRVCSEVPAAFYALKDQGCSFDGYCPAAPIIQANQIPLGLNADFIQRSERVDAVRMVWM